MTARRVRLALGACLLATGPTRSQQSAELPDDRAPGAATIAADDLRSWLTELTSPALGGRGTGTAGFELAATLLREHFQALQLRPAGDDGTFWQRVPWTGRAADAQSSFLRIEVDGEGEELCRLRPGSGLHGRASRPVAVAGPVVVVVPTRNGSIRPGPHLDGAIALVWAVDRAIELDARPRPAALRNAAAVLLVDDLACGQHPELAGSTRPGPGAANRAVQANAGSAPDRLYVPAAPVDRLLATAGRSRRDLSPGKVLELGNLRAELRLDIVEVEAPAYNVVAVLPGSDPALAAEHVVIGCHLDHLGLPGGVLHPGADDDGSGTVGLMAVARALASNPQPPRRSVLFVAFCGEELGLVGSGYFVDHPPIPLSSIVAELQMDMIGRHEESANEQARRNENTLHLIGTKKLSPELHRLCVERNDRFAHFHLEWDEEEVFYRSDHFNFARQGIPVAFFFTGFHRDYHRPTDTVERIDFAILRRVATHVYDVATELANADGRPQVDARLWARLRRELKGRVPAEPAAPLAGRRR